MNAGIYHMSKDILKFIEPACSHKGLSPELARQRLLTGEVAGGYFIEYPDPTGLCSGEFGVVTPPPPTGRILRQPRDFK